ncbi:hypothetical protein ACN6U0_002417 [Cronobacter turicensis]
MNSSGKKLLKNNNWSTWSMKIENILCLLPLLALSSCVLSEDLSPPVDGKAVKIAVVKPVDVDILPMDVIYRSEKCRDKVFTSTGAITTRAGYHRLTVPFNPEKGSNIVSNNIALDGGGQCEWKISNIRFQFKFSKMDRFGINIKKNIPNDIVFMFDDNQPPRGNGHKDNVMGDVLIIKDYYALINDKFTDDGFDVLHIEGQPLLTYRVYNVRNIIFKPNVHSDIVVNVLTPQKKEDDYIILYPNGERVADHLFPFSDKTRYEFVRQKTIKK